MAFTLEITDRKSGVPLSPNAKLQAPILTPVSGQNRLQVSWSKDSGQNPQEFVEIRVLLDSMSSPGIIKNLEINWGDGNIETIYLGSRIMDRHISHVYLTTAATISIELSFSVPNDITLNESIAVNAKPSSDFYIEQVKFEKYEDEVFDLRPGWTPVEQVAPTFTDAHVRRGFSYRYRVLARARDIGKADIIESAPSEITQVGPWG